ncbi:hypothetical protein JRO89_XS06G0031700 [Xanthoceras sorbifolium]|uniref:Uncharacterized protein n=1 Tax=Xanthoceras sorbifolium TaxID=99658 RepID=A0ABQ8HWD4_9ROSI|nr:hypothetical protein JRO89_XS06G0031700 [Xanthoceras sorbifolium]
MEKAELVEGKVDWKGRTAVKYKHGGTKTSLLILAAFGFENMASFSLGVNLVRYFNGELHFELADAANQVTNYLGTSFVLSILVAVVADTYVGRFTAVLISGCVEFLGFLLLTIQAHFPKLKPPPCNEFHLTSHCKKIEASDAAVLFVAIYLIAMGTAGIKAALPTHGADQFDDEDPQEARHMSSFFNCLVLAISVGAAVYVAAIRNKKLRLPKDPAELYEIDKDNEAAIDAEFLSHRDIFRWLDKAAIQTSTGESEIPKDPKPWKLCTVTQVENAKIILGMVPIFYCTIIMTLCLAQLQTFSIQQGLTMDTSLTKSFNIPPASLPIIPVAFMIILVPIYDQVFVPFARKITGLPTGITHLQRVGVGLVLSSLSMATAAIMEVKRKGVARDHNMLDANPLVQPLPISTFWLSMQFFIMGIADMFTYVGLLEFFYSEAPKGLKSISTCFLWSSMALGYYLSTIVVSIVNRATKTSTKSGGWLAGNNINRNHLNLFFMLLSILSLINFCFYLFFAMRYNYRHQSVVAPDENTKIQQRYKL